MSSTLVSKKSTRVQNYVEMDTATEIIVEQSQFTSFMDALLKVSLID